VDLSNLFLVFVILSKTSITVLNDDQTDLTASARTVHIVFDKFLNFNEFSISTNLFNNGAYHPTPVLFKASRTSSNLSSIVPSLLTNLTTTDSLSVCDKSNY